MPTMPPPRTHTSTSDSGSLLVGTLAAWSRVEATHQERLAAGSGGADASAASILRMLSGGPPTVVFRRAENMRSMDIMPPMVLGMPQQVGEQRGWGCCCAVGDGGGAHCSGCASAGAARESGEARAARASMRCACARRR